MTLHDLPKVNATLNGLSAVFLGFGFYFIKRKNVPAHKRCMLAAFATSVLFLACYLTYHIAVHTVTHFRDPPWFRPYYLALLLTHTVLATVIVPLILITLSRALRQRFELHRKIARWTWPLWMYVSVTGVLVYLILYQIFPKNSDPAALAPSSAPLLPPVNPENLVNPVKIKRPPFTLV